LEKLIASCRSHLYKETTLKGKESEEKGRGAVKRKKMKVKDYFYVKGGFSERHKVFA